MAMKDASVVLAHGAWADGSSWARVITALKAQSVRVFAAPLPLTSLADDVAALNRSLDRTEGPIVVAAHAYAGAEAFKRDNPDAEVHLLDAGHFALESRGPEIAAILRDFLARRIS